MAGAGGVALLERRVPYRGDLPDEAGVARGAHGRAALHPDGDRRLRVLPDHAAGFAGGGNGLGAGRGLVSSLGRHHASTALIEESRSVITLEARPGPIAIDPVSTAVIVVDMQNDFGSKGGMFDRAGLDISGIQQAVAPTARVLAAARKAGIRILYLKMGYERDLSDLGGPDSVNRRRHLQL